MSTIYNFWGVVVTVSGSPTNWITTAPPTGGQSDGTSANDSLGDRYGSPATLEGLNGDDTYYIQDTRTTIVETATGGIDNIIAYNNYTLPQNVEMLAAHSDTVTVVSNNQGGVLEGYNYRDVLVAGTGTDELVNAGGQQTIFVEGAGSGHDAIYGFNTSGTSHDLLALRDSKLSYDQLIAGATQQGSDVLLSPSQGTQLLLKNTTLASLGRADFLLDHSTSGEKATFTENFNALSLWTGPGSTGVWKTNFESGAQIGYSSVTSRTLAGNGEQEIYVDPAYSGDPNHSSAALGINPFSVANGVLTITATKTPTADLSALFNQTYTSGLLTTSKSFAQTYGYFEMRAEVPTDQGAWPAFWLLPQAAIWPPELDVMENVSKGYSTGGAISKDGNGAFYNYYPQGLTGYHTYGLEWTPTTLTWYVDGHAFGSMATPSDMHQPMYLLVNLAVGGYWPGNATFDSTAEHIDYVHAFALATGETDSYGPDGVVTKHFAGLAGYSYTAYDAVYDVSGTLTGKLFYDAAGHTVETDTYAADGSYTAHATAAAGAAYAASDSAYDAAGRLTAKTLYDAAGHTVETDTYAADGSYTAHVTAAAGAAYAASDSAYDAAGRLTAKTLYDAAGHTVETDTYAADGSHSAHVCQILGEPYSSYIATYDAVGNLQSQVFYNLNGDVWTPPAADPPPVATPPVQTPAPVVTPDPPVVTPAPPVETPPVETPAPVVTPDPPVVTPAPPVETPPVETPAPVVTPDPPVVTPAPPVETPPVETPAPVVTPDPPVVTPAPPVETPPVETPAPVVTPDPPVVTPAPPVETPPPDQGATSEGAAVYSLTLASHATIHDPYLINAFHSGVDQIDVSGVSPQAVYVLHRGGAEIAIVATPHGLMELEVKGDLLQAGDFTADHALRFAFIGSAAPETLKGGEALDTLDGGGGADVLIGGGHGDILTGGAGSDTFTYLASSDSTPRSSDTITDFQTGVDRLDLSAVGLQTVSIVQQSGSSVLTATTASGPMQINAHGAINGSDISGLSSGVSITVGDGEAHSLEGSMFDDTLTGGAGADTLAGGGGDDLLTGGAGADVFLFVSASGNSSKPTATISDFTHGLDRIDISTLHTAGSTFAFTVADGSTLVTLDPDGHGTHDAFILLQGVTDAAPSDFIW